MLAFETRISTDDLARSYGPYVFKICRRMLSDADTARDAAQEVWLEILRSYPAFRGDSKVSTWIFTITTRTVFRWLKNERKNSFGDLLIPFRTAPPYEPPSREPDRLEAWIRSVCDHCLTAILRCLESKSRMVYVLRGSAGLGYEEIAEILSLSPPAVRQMFSRSSRKIRRFGTAECALFNPKGKCRCRMKPWVEKSAFVRELLELRRKRKNGNLLANAEALFSCFRESIERRGS